MAPGVLWSRIPLPLRLNHVNVWALEDEAGWTVIDAGPDTMAAREIWETLFAGPLRGKPITRLIATHGHLDHVGLAGWFVQRQDACFTATLTEWQGARLRRLGEDDAAGQMDRFLIRHGCDPQSLQGFASHRATTMKLLGEQPPELVRIREGDEVRIGGRVWRVIVAGGHADEHASFYCEADRILIAGDQVLPRITPVIGVFPSQPLADPLSDYLASLTRFEDLPPDCLVLPSHGEPFFGLRTRIAALREHHEERLARILELVAEPATCWTVAASVFARAVSEGQGRLALAESLAHLHRLARLGEVATLHDGHDETIRFVRTAGRPRAS
ncbi:MBL fold metallo-hydrolase [Alsobacter sp. SYSU M60028]|uniref:MBL fold metallo-hydrolase n=1 Tax=Alsobacter ponti TaxID=2962936 RepID=A0ABT1LBE4_9HYPH|nr:MBL fold metallo-hydrolase [Alsobacter ponti]